MGRDGWRHPAAAVRELLDRLAGRYPLIQGAAERLPFAPASFDVVFCDHGGLSWAPPHLAVPQAARVLRRGGRLVSNVTSPWFEVCYDGGADRVTTRLRPEMPPGL